MSRYRNDRDDYREREDDRSGSYGARERERGSYGGQDFRREEYGGERHYGGRGGRGEYSPGEMRPGSYGGRDFYGGGRGAEHDRYYDRVPEPRGASRSHVRCRDIMTRDVTVATKETTLQEVAAMMRDEDTGVIPVVEQTGATTETNTATAAAAVARGGGAATTTTNAAAPSNTPPEAGGRRRSYGKLVGLITDRDIVVRALAEGQDARTASAADFMTTDVHTAQPNDRVIDAIRKMGDKQVRRIPVVDNDGNLRGIISMADVALETEEDRELANALEEISSGASFWSKIFG